MENVISSHVKETAAREISEASGSYVCGPVRYALLAFGWLNVGLGIIGVFLPVMPTTVFLLMALWAFSKSSTRFHSWLYSHRYLGRPLRDWHAHRVIPPQAKATAVTMMSASWIFVAFFVANDWALPALLAGIMVPAASYILSRPSRPSGAAEELL
ncbi:MAG: YbaN family protein [Rhodospirillales bacterium]|jgi:hypothetical protein|nr:YbaN family protein [Rhodospirillales bacterium]MBT4006971.1 YbaN family protein [Rhodospirillales bacterium]MBT5112831.1 YbaN family protein [Rhodospirillales bacterium]MBT5673602.1 YbaN family protein [Rhodospirillales bacterium]MBT6186260.1 YbaN family protein [Rhodospirillales bacterium]